MKAAVILALAVVVASVCLPAAQAAYADSGASGYKSQCQEGSYGWASSQGTDNAWSGVSGGTYPGGTYAGGSAGAQDKDKCCDPCCDDPCC